MEQICFHQLAAAQYGLVTRQQALVYFTRHELQKRVRAGRLVQVRRQVYRCEGVPASWRQKLMAVCLSAGPPVAASHFAAARLWGLEGFESAKLEITVPRNRNAGIGRQADVIVHWANLTPADITTTFGIPTTTAVRTVIDLSAVLNEDVLEKALDEALRRKLFTIAELERQLRTTRSGGHRRLQALRRLVRARGLDYQPGESTPEDRTYNWLVDAGFPPPERQYWVTLNGEKKRIDLAYPDLRIAIEYDSWEHHKTRRKFDDDRARAGELQLASWLVLQFTSKSTQQDVLGKVGRARAQRARSA